ncbi:hypothetical protein LXA43DRAFT_199774 [Ganoderma leucocontextum]|nr:hypothetical protein LXA43DRAFT_199774 [Ganoderma leucocontextum]
MDDGGRWYLAAVCCYLAAIALISWLSCQSEPSGVAAWCTYSRSNTSGPGGVNWKRTRGAGALIARHPPNSVGHAQLVFGGGVRGLSTLVLCQSPLSPRKRLQKARWVVDARVLPRMD